MSAERPNHHADQRKCERPFPEIPELSQIAFEMPKVELHRHLEGALTPEMILRVCDRHAIELPTRSVEELRPLVQVTPADRDLLDFLKKFEFLGQLFRSQAVIEDLTYESVQAAAAENIRYLELRFSPAYMALAHDLALAEVMEGVVGGVARGTEASEISVNLIVIFERQMGVPTAWRVFQAARDYSDRGVVAIDLANDEVNFPPEPYKNVFAAVKHHGLSRTVHAGEAGPAQNVRSAIELLGAQRIGHGVRAIDDPDLISILRNNGIPLEVCPTSNVQTGTVRDLKSHPLVEFMEQGVAVNLSTDDPGVCGITLTDELVRTVRECGLVTENMRSFMLAAADAAFVPEPKRLALRDEIETWWQENASTD